MVSNQLKILKFLPYHNMKNTFCIFIYHISQYSYHKYLNFKHFLLIQTMVKNGRFGVYSSHIYIFMLLYVFSTPRSICTRVYFYEYESFISLPFLTKFVYYMISYTSYIYWITPEHVFSLYLFFFSHTSLSFFHKNALNAIAKA